MLPLTKNKLERKAHMILDTEITSTSTSWTDVCFLLLPWSCTSSYNCWAKALCHEAKNKQKKLHITGFFFWTFFLLWIFFQAIKANFYVYLRTSYNIKQNKIHVAVDKIATALPPGGDGAVVWEPGEMGRCGCPSQCSELKFSFFPRSVWMQAVLNQEQPSRFSYVLFC